jgi:hypothetical protein
MREYRQLTEDDRIEIYAMKQAGKEQNMMTALNRPSRKRYSEDSTPARLSK